MVLGGMLVHPWEQARDALRATPRADGGRARRADGVRRAHHRARRSSRSRPSFRAARSSPSPSPGAATSRRASASSRRCGRSCPPALDLVGADALPRAADDARRDRAAWPALLRPAALPPGGRATTFIDALLAAFERVAVAVRARHDRVDGRRRSTTSPPGATAFGHRGARALTWIIGCSGDGPIEPAADWVRAPGRRRRRSPPAASTSTPWTTAGRCARPTPTRSGSGSSTSSAATTPTGRSPGTASAD